MLTRLSNGIEDGKQFTHGGKTGATFSPTQEIALTATPNNGNNKHFTLLVYFDTKYNTNKKPRFDNRA